MEPCFSIRSPALLHIKTARGISYGANQIWFSSHWQRQSGCGPTVAATLLWYLAQTRQSCRALCPEAVAEQAAFTRYMHVVWQSVTPGPMGTPANQFIRGALEFGNSRGVNLSYRSLPVPARGKERPSVGACMQFLYDAFNDDLPVAFQNYSNGAVRELDAWHWVTLVSAQAPYATMFDQSLRRELDFALWHKTANRAGRLVTLHPL